MTKLKTATTRKIPASSARVSALARPQQDCSALGDSFNEADDAGTHAQHVREKERQRAEHHFARKIVEETHDAEGAKGWGEHQLPADRPNRADKGIADWPNAGYPHLRTPIHASEPRDWLVNASTSDQSAIQERSAGIHHVLLRIFGICCIAGVNLCEIREANGMVECPSRPLRVLVIDDEVAVRETIADMLAADGHQVVVAADGAEGLGRLEREPPVDVVLTDLCMPGMTGWEVARAVKARRPNLPVGLVTGWGANLPGRPEDAQATDFVLSKPVTMASLRGALARTATIR